MPHFEENIYRVKRLTSDGKEIRWSLRAGDFIRPGYTTATKVRSWVNPKTKQEIKDNATAELELIEAEKDFKEFGPTKDDNKEERENLVVFYQNYSTSNKMKNNRHLAGSLNQFKLFLKEEKKLTKIPTEKVTEDLCTDFRNWLLKKFNGETPGNYFARFKQMLKAAIKKELIKDRRGNKIQISPAADVQCLKNPATEKKVAISDSEYDKVVASICPNEEIKRALVFSLYTGMRWCDVKVLTWDKISDHDGVPVFSIIQLKTGLIASGPIDKIAFKYLGKKKGKNDLIFKLPSSTTTNEILKKWINDIGIEKKFTWHCCRHSFIMWAKRRNMPPHIIAGIVGHKGVALIHSDYNHYDLDAAIAIMRPDFKPMKVVENDQLAQIDKLLSRGFTHEQISRMKVG